MCHTFISHVFTRGGKRDFHSFSYPANDESQAVFMFCSHFPRMANISKLKKALISVDKGEETEDGDDNCGDDADGGDNQ